MEKEKKESKDVIQIPVGKFFSKLRTNPWMLSSIVLGIIVIVLLFTGGSTGVKVASADVVGEKVVALLNSQVGGWIELDSVEKISGVHQVNARYNGQIVPVYATIDGKNLISALEPLTEPTDSETNNNERTNVNIEGAPYKGAGDAPVTIVEFTDYQCPFCAKHFEETFYKINAEYIGKSKVKYVILDFPLSIHPEAQKSAEAAHCFAEQKGNEGYFRYHDKLFQNQNELSMANYKLWAQQLGASGVQFDSCLNSGKYEAKVKASEAYGATLGVTGTPAFFINGIKLEGAYPYEQFQQIIDSELGSQ